MTFSETHPAHKGRLAAAERQAQLLQTAFLQISEADTDRLLAIYAQAKSTKIAARMRKDDALEQCARHIEKSAERRLARLRR
jgi:hypothetical protein